MLFKQLIFNIFISYFHILLIFIINQVSLIIAITFTILAPQVDLIIISIN